MNYFKLFALLLLMLVVSVFSLFLVSAYYIYPSNYSCAADIVDCYNGNDTDLETYASGCPGECMCSNYSIYINFTDSFYPSGVYPYLNLKLDLINESYIQIFCWNEAGGKWDNFYIFTTGLQFPSIFIPADCRGTIPWNYEMMFRLDISYGEQKFYESWIEPMVIDEGLSGGAPFTSYPYALPILPISEVIETIKGGASLIQVLEAYNPQLYPLVISSWKSLVSCNIEFFPDYFFNFCSVLVKYIFRQPASLVPGA